MNNWLRWLAVLPAALLAIFLAAFPLHWILYQTLTGSGMVEPYPEAPERILQPFASSLAFTLVGALVAPTHRVRVATVLLGLVVLLHIVTALLMLNGVGFGDKGYSFDAPILSRFLSVAGAAIGLLIVYKQKS